MLRSINLKLLFIKTKTQQQWWGWKSWGYHFTTVNLLLLIITHETFIQESACGKIEDSESEAGDYIITKADFCYFQGLYDRQNNSTVIFRLTLVLKAIYPISFIYSSFLQTKTRCWYIFFSYLICIDYFMVLMH